MGFKLGSERSPALNKGQVESNFSFSQRDDSSVPGTPILRKDLEGGILGESNNDGSIFISHELEPGSQNERHVVMHEMVHQTDMKLGKLKYTDNSVTWNGKTHARQDGMIEYEGQWLPEGDKGFPWEKMPWE
jgi:hypothetical protein